MLRPATVDNGHAVRLAGAFIAIFALVMGLAVVFIVPSANVYATGFELLAALTAFFGGIAVYLGGQFFMKKKL